MRYFGGCGLSDFIIAKNDKNYIASSLAYIYYRVRQFDDGVCLTARECWWHMSLLNRVVALIDTTHSLAHHELGGGIVSTK